MRLHNWVLNADKNDPLKFSNMNVNRNLRPRVFLKQSIQIQAVFQNSLDLGDFLARLDCTL